MVYEWKLPGLYSVPAQEAGQELDRIYREHGKLDAPDIVEESRPDGAVLHPCFEWNDPKAAELYRQYQARQIVCCIVTVKETKRGGEAVTRAYEHVGGTYHPINVIIQCADKSEELRKTAFLELESFRKKFQTVDELVPVFDAIEKVLEQERGGR